MTSQLDATDIVDVVFALYSLPQPRAIRPKIRGRWLLVNDG